ncbi:hypothetical protein Leryth_011804, partial [Lithospermum erythrorhizon]
IGARRRTWKKNDKKLNGFSVRNLVYAPSRDIKGKDVALSTYKGNMLLIFALSINKLITVMVWRYLHFLAINLDPRSLEIMRKSNTLLALVLRPRSQKLLYVGLQEEAVCIVILVTGMLVYRYIELNPYIIRNMFEALE